MCEVAKQGLCAVGLMMLMLLSACSSNRSADVVRQGVVFEPEAIDRGPALTDEEVIALRSTGEIDRNLPSTAMSDVTKQFSYYLRDGRKHMQASVTRAEKYLPYARNVFRERRMPEDLAYLAIIESGYRPDVKSGAGAVGAWQFISGTGKLYGLHQDTWTDERMDIYEATEAAALYLKDLYGKFHDWPTAIAAYNAGEGKMRRAIQGAGARNFFEVRERNETLPENLRLREETKQYVPRFLAVTKIMRNLDRLNFRTSPDENRNVARVEAGPATDLKALTNAICMNWGDFCLLNRHHRAYITSASHPTYVYVPENKQQEARTFIKNNNRGEYAGWRVCSISSPGQSWKKLENYYHVSSEKLRALNPGCSLKTGELIYLPGQKGLVAQKGSGASVSLRNETRAYVSENSRKHVLKSSETLYALSRKYGVSPTELMRINNIRDASQVPVGTVLNIPSYSKPQASGVQVAASPSVGGSTGKLGQKKATVYVVQEHDNLWNIARRKGVSVDDLKRWNNVDEHSLKQGTHLRVYAD